MKKLFLSMVLLSSVATQAVACCGCWPWCKGDTAESSTKPLLQGGGQGGSGSGLRSPLRPRDTNAGPSTPLAPSKSSGKSDDLTPKTKAIVTLTAENALLKQGREEEEKKRKALEANAEKVVLEKHSKGRDVSTFTGSIDTFQAIQAAAAKTDVV